MLMCVCKSISSNPVLLIKKLSTSILNSFRFCSLSFLRFACLLLEEKKTGFFYNIFFTFFIKYLVPRFLLCVKHSSFYPSFFLIIFRFSFFTHFMMTKSSVFLPPHLHTLGRFSDFCIFFFVPNFNVGYCLIFVILCVFATCAKMAFVFCQVFLFYL